MANPQLEGGYLKLANELFDALIRTRIPGEARQVLDMILRKTYGYHKKTDRIPLSQFVKMTNIPRPHVIRAIKLLQRMNLIIKSGCKSGSVFAFNKDYDTWRLLPKKARAQNGNNLVPKKAIGSAQNGNKLVPFKAHSKDIKDTYSKDTIKDSGSRLKRDPQPDHGRFVKFWCDEYEKRFGVPYKYGKAKDGKLVKDLLTCFGFDKFCQMVLAFFDSEDEWIKKAGFTIPLFSNQANQIAQKADKGERHDRSKYDGLEQNV